MLNNKFFSGFSLVAVLVLLVAGFSYASSQQSKANVDSVCACTTCCQAGACCDTGSCCDQGDCKCEQCECDCCKPSVKATASNKECCSVEKLVSSTKAATSCNADSACCETACVQGECESSACGACPTK